MKTIQITLGDYQSVQQAVKRVRNYGLSLDKKMAKLREEVANTIKWVADSGFSAAVVDDIINGSTRYAKVNVYLNNQGNVTLVIADGEDAVWVEFGAGIYHNTAVGSSLHPKGAELGFTIGSMGKNAERDVWGFYENGQLVLTHGTPAAMPMWRGLRYACDHIDEIARRVFA